jgi:N-acetylmuramoyl-L-alanine amidase
MGQYMLIITNDWLGNFLVKIGAATEAKEVQKDEPKPVPTVPPRSKIRIGLNSGHFSVKGASGKNPAIQEHIENAAQRDRVKELLEATGRFECINIDQNQFNGDLLATGKAFKGFRVGIAFHQNAYNGVQHGSEVIAIDTDESKELGKKLSAAMATALGIKDRGLRDHAVSITNGAKSVGCPCFVLTESHFVDPETDPAEARRKTLVAADAIAKVLISHFS